MSNEPIDKLKKDLKKQENLYEIRDKLQRRLKELIRLRYIIIYIDTDSIMYIDDKLNLIEEDIDKL